MIEDFARAIRRLQVVQEIAQNDGMWNSTAGLPRYLSVGRSGIRLILTAAVARLGYPGGDVPISTILDFGSGYGRVTRFMRTVFPAADITVTDRNRDAVDWCVSNLGVSSLEGDIPNDHYDLIFLGSVFTHTPKAVTSDLITGLTGALRKGGLLVFTTQGRYAAGDIEAHPTRNSYGLNEEQRQLILTEFRSEGYGFASQAQGQNYGISLIDRSWFDSGIGREPSFILAFFQEKGYDNHQDAYAYLKCSISEDGRSGL